MGREDGMLGVVKELVIQCSKLNIPCVIDADALYMLSVHPEICDSLKCAVLTPNAMEYARLCSSVKLIADANVEEAIKIEPHVYLSKLKNAYVWMVLKGHRDTIAGAGVCSRYVDAFNSPKRCGGLGDVRGLYTGIKLKVIDNGGMSWHDDCMASSLRGGKQVYESVG